MPKRNILFLLAGGDRRTIGRADEVVAMVSEHPNLFPDLMQGLWSEEPLIRMRAADAAEKVTRANPALLNPYKKEVLGLAAEIAEQEMRWHLAAILPRLALNTKERDLAVSILNRYLEDRSSIVKTFALQGLADLARSHATLRPSVIELLRESARTGTPAMKARSRKLLLQFERLQSPW